MTKGYTEKGHEIYKLMVDFISDNETNSLQYNDKGEPKETNE
jgi:hypothetical protein